MLDKEVVPFKGLGQLIGMAQYRVHAWGLQTSKKKTAVAYKQKICSSTANYWNKVVINTKKIWNFNRYVLHKLAA